MTYFRLILGGLALTFLLGWGYSKDCAWAGGTGTIVIDKPLSFQRLSTEDGLSYPNVYCILQDRRGFMWFATKYGLNRYDGMDFRVYTHDSDDPNSLSDNYILHMTEDSQGILWILTYDGGLNAFDPATERFTRYQHDPDDPHSLNAGNACFVFEDSLRQLWVGTEEGLDRFDRESETFIRYVHDPGDPSSLGHHFVTMMAEDRQGFLWIGSFGGGVLRYDPRKDAFTRYSHQDGDSKSLSHDEVFYVYVDSRNMLWIGTQHGLNRLDPAAGPSGELLHEEFVRYVHDPDDSGSLGHNRVRALHEDTRGTLWVGTTGGLSRYDRVSDRFVSYRSDSENPRSLSHNSIYFLNEDDAGALWIATASGLSKMDPRRQQIELYLHDTQVQALYEDEQGILWAGTGGKGLVRVDRSRNLVIPNSPDSEPFLELSGNIITKILPDSEGWLWIGAQNGGLNHCDLVTGECRRYHNEPGNPDSLHNNVIMDLVLAEDGRLWIATGDRGLDVFDPQNGRFRNYAHRPDEPESLASNWTRTVFLDSQGVVWVGSEGGASRLDPRSDTFVHYQRERGDPTSLSNNIVNMFCEDSAGRLWIATNDGLNALDPSGVEFTVYRSADGLPGNSISAILEDNSGFLWISTNNGLSKFDPAQKSFRNYDRQDGLQGRQFIYHSAYKNRDGELFFGGVNGVNVFSPESLSDNPYIPPVVLTDIQIANRPVGIGGNSPLQQDISVARELQLSHEHSAVSLKFAALNYQASLKNQYAYRLEGLDRDWIVTGSRNRIATYTNLSPGSYRFRVKASNNDGLWNEEGATLAVTILPPWWRSWWAENLMAVCLLSVGVAFYYWRVRAIQRRNRRLEALVTKRTRDLQESEARSRDLKNQAERANRAKSVFLANMSHELRTPLNAILGFTQVMVRDPRNEKEHENLRVILRSGEHLLTLINQVLDLSKIEAGHVTLDEKIFNLRYVLDELYDLFLLRTQQKGLGLRFDYADDLPQWIRSDEVKLRQVLINLLNNALKFTKDGRVQLAVSRRQAAGNSGQAAVCSREFPKIQTPPPSANCQLSTEHCLLSTEHCLLFTVTDTGPGISPEELESVFEPFSQTESGRLAQEGTGLGLPISRKFVRLMGGDLSVDSQPGQGSSFCFDIRAGVVKESAQDGRQSTQKRRVIGIEEGQPQLRLLIVDDHSENRRLLVELLEPFGFELHEAVNGREAIDAWETWQPHLIWMDIRMPVLDGFGAAAEIRRREAAAGGGSRRQVDRTAIVALSAGVFEEEHAPALSKGCDDFLRKPFRAHELFDALHAQLGIRFVYEDEQPEQKPVGEAPDLSGLTELSDELLERMRLIFLTSDMANIAEVIDEVRLENAALADTLDRLSQNFQYAIILDALGNYQEGDGANNA